TNEKMNFDEIIETIGSFGKYQKIQVVLLCLPHIHAGIFMVISVILLGVPEHRCKIPGYSGDTYTIQSPEHQTMVDNYIPKSTDSTKDYDQCHVYNDTNSYNNTFIGNRTIVECDSWVYSQSVFTETFVTKHHLVCRHDDILSLTKMLFFVGVLVGSFTFGMISDKFGRKFSMCCAQFLQMITSVALAWAPNLYVYIFLRFIIGATSTGIVLTTFVLTLELVGPTKRVRAAMLNGFFFAAGEVIVAGLGYLLRDWQYVELVAGSTTVFFLSFIWLVPESPRWLLNHGKMEKAERVIKRIAEVNKMSQHLSPTLNYKEDQKQRGNILHIFTSKVLLIRTLILFLEWCVISMTFYGLALNAGNIGGDFYLNFMLLGLVDFPTTILLLLLLNRIGRKKMFCTSMIVGGVGCISTLFTTTYGGESLNALTVVLVLIGKLGAGCAFGTIYLMSSELFPTVVRNAGMGACSCFARFGSMVAPYVISSAADIGGTLGKAVPLITFGSASVVAGLIALLLPETINKDLPDTIEEGKQFGTSNYDSLKKEGRDNKGFAMEQFNDSQKSHL
ncbi:organic cation transporter protein-like, partial [Ylistrum balloti]|uniref:organic cation transporter protein-like n=1 Tax=Ylistrum balloti TaxID=509963 RepID=UPI002905EBDD